MTFNSFSLLKSETVCSSCFVFIMIQVEKKSIFLKPVSHIQRNKLNPQINYIVSMHTLMNYLKNGVRFLDQHEYELVSLWIVNYFLNLDDGIKISGKIDF